MADQHYERLSAQDSSFVMFEGASSHVHVTAIALFDARPLRDDAGRLDMGRIRAHIESRLHLLPRYRQHLAFTPVQRHPIWVDDAGFDLTYHVRHVGLPLPGSDEQLKELVAGITSNPLDRSRPLWEMWFAEGLVGDRVAVVAKVHHCMVDGISGVGVLTSLLSGEPDPTVVPAEPWTPRPAPGVLGFLAEGARSGVRAPVSVVRTLADALRTPRETTEWFSEGVAATVQTLYSGLRIPPRTPFNARIGAQRRVEWCELDLNEVRDLKKRLGGTVNDVVLSVVSGAVRRYLKHRRVPLKGLNLRVVVPVDTRNASDVNVANRVSPWFLSMPIAERDPLRRFTRIRSQTRHFKRSRAHEGIDRFLRFADLTGSTRITSLGVGLVGAVLPYNLIVSNIPGPDFPLYLLGARLHAFYPHLPLFENQGLAMAAMSYLGRIQFGLLGDRDLVPDLPVLREAVRESFAELRAAAERKR